MLTEVQKAFVAPFVTSIDSNVYALVNVPPQVAAAVIARLSRSQLGVRELLATEFTNDLPNPPPVRTIQADAESFHDRVLGKYGDDSVADMAGVHIIFEDISAFAAKAIQERRLAGYIEKSTRYVPMYKVDGNYPYHIPVELAAAEYSALAYIQMMNKLFDRYHEVQEGLIKWYMKHVPRDEGTTERAWMRSIEAQALDGARGLLPLSLNTTMGMFANARTYEYLIYNLEAEGIAEFTDIANKLHEATRAVVPAMIRRVGTLRGDNAVRRLATMKASRKAAPPLRYQAEISSVHLVRHSEDGMNDILSDIWFENSRRGHDQEPYITLDHSQSDVDELLETQAGKRESRFDRLGRAFEAAAYTFEIVSSIGAWRDLQRHRMTSQSRQQFKASLGYETPDIIRKSGMETLWQDAAGNAGTFADFIGGHLNNTDLTAYALPLCYRVRWRISMNLRELCHLVELRTQPQGHAEYRMIAWQMFDIVNEIQPELAKYIQFVVTDEVLLARLTAEEKAERRLGI